MWGGLNVDIDGICTWQADDNEGGQVGCRIEVVGGQFYLVIKSYSHQ